MMNGTYRENILFIKEQKNEKNTYNIIIYNLYNDNSLSSKCRK